MKVACIQLSSGKDYNKNFKDVIKYIYRAIENNADLIITPETTSLITNSKKDLYKYSYTVRKDPLIKQIRNLANKNNKFILIGSLIIKDKKKLKNRSILINQKGRVIAQYDKINMFDAKISKREEYFESKIYKAGKRLVCANLPWGKIGLTICYDLRFPELYRNLSKRNLSFISVPSAFTKHTGKKHWLTLLRARAIENFCYIFAPNQTGKNSENRETFGHSVIISPDGKILALKKNGKGVIYSEINPKTPMILRKIIPSLK